MSETSQHDIACPTCGAEQRVELIDTLSVDEHPEGRTALLKGEINRVTCPKCGGLFRIDKPMTYRDKENEIFILYDPLVAGRTLPDVEKTFQEGQKLFREVWPAGVALPEMNLVVEWTELVERVLLLEEGLDVRIVEHIKYMMYQQHPGQIPAASKNLVFDEPDSTDEQLCFVVQDRHSHKLEKQFFVARSDYEALLNVFDLNANWNLLVEQFPGPYICGRLRFLMDQREEGFGGEAEEPGAGAPR